MLRSLTDKQIAHPKTNTSSLLLLYLYRNETR